MAHDPNTMTRSHVRDMARQVLVQLTEFNHHQRLRVLEAAREMIHDDLEAEDGGAVVTLPRERDAPSDSTSRGG